MFRRHPKEQFAEGHTHYRADFEVTNKVKDAAAGKRFCYDERLIRFTVFPCLQVGYVDSDVKPKKDSDALQLKTDRKSVV